MNPASDSEIFFYRTLKTNVKLVHLYENLNVLKYAADIIPTEDLNMKATLKLSVLEDSDNTITFEDIFLLELMSWFKCSFFTWVDAPNCKSCGQPSQKRGNVPPNETEKQWIVNTVEQFFCTKCNLVIRFPRYNHPRKLLETREGRCGEWAKCFTLLCRALGYDARLVYDWADHVWTEVFSFSKNRWLHCDPCENVCDKPLLYEIGWKKPISYIIAFSKDEIQDVTWRYSSNFSNVLKRRKLCREEWLLNCILEFTSKLQLNSSFERRQELCKRRAMELAQFLTPAKVEDEKLDGRTSGSLAWRIARGEAHLEPNTGNYVFMLTEEEVAQKYFHVKYSCALDKYIRVSDGCRESESWSTCAFVHENIFRKVETDWKFVYLARTEDSATSVISWKFTFNSSGLTIHTLKVYFKSATFESGRVKWIISSDTNPDIFKTYLNNDISLHTDDFKGCSDLIISAELSEGSGKEAWQHTQLFRQSIDSTDFPFEVRISFKEK